MIRHPRVNKIRPVGFPGIVLFWDINGPLRMIIIRGFWKGRENKNIFGWYEKEKWCVPSPLSHP